MQHILSPVPATEKMNCLYWHVSRFSFFGMMLQPQKSTVLIKCLYNILLPLMQTQRWYVNIGRYHFYPYCSQLLFIITLPLDIKTFLTVYVTL